MLEKHYIQRKENTDLNVYRCGVEECAPSHSWGPGVRDHYLIHMIQNGKGMLTIKGTSYHLHKGDGFVLFPDVLASWQADALEPWTYAWVGFHGLRASSILEKAGEFDENPVISMKNHDELNAAFMSLLHAARIETTDNLNTNADSLSKDLLLTGYLYLFLSNLIISCRSATPHKNKSVDKSRHIRLAMAYIARHYQDSFSIQEMAASIGLERSYLSTLFKKLTGSSPQTHLIHFRMERAVELMNHDQLSIADIARSVGYDDPAQFSKVFRSEYGKSPMQYRKLLLF